MKNQNNEKVLEVKNLKQYFVSGIGSGRVVNKAVDGISFDVFKGETFGIVGESGCGKTTTGRSIIKIYEPTGGEVFLYGERISSGTYEYKLKMAEEKKSAKHEMKELKKQYKVSKETKISISERAETRQESKYTMQSLKEKQMQQYNIEKKRIKKRLEKKLNELKKNYDLALEQYQATLKVPKSKILNIQMVFQDPIASLNPRMTVNDIIAEGLREMKKFSETEITTKIHEVLDVVGLLPEHGSRYPHEFSGGQRQRIGIARAIIVKPDVLIADEPISALDVSVQSQVINLLNQLQKKLGLTIIFIAHDLSVVKYFSDRIAVMYFGKIVEMGDSKMLFNNPLHPYTKSLLSSVPLPDPYYERRRKRIMYDPSLEHDYSKEKPKLTEIESGHFVLASPSEVRKIKRALH